jgi:hypothetical protein
MPTLPKSLRSFVSALQLRLLLEYWLAFKDTAWEIFWGASVIGIIFTVYTLYRSPSLTTVLICLLLVQFLTGYFIWRVDHLRLKQRAELTTLHERFAGYMNRGEALAAQMRRGMRDYGAWLQQRREWVEEVSSALSAEGLPTEAAAFRHAGEGDPDINLLAGPNQAAYWYRFYMGQLDKWREKLAEIVARRFGFPF